MSRTLLNVMAVIYAALMLTGCGTRNDGLRSIHYADSTECVRLTVDARLPRARKGPDAVIRDTLLAELVRQFENFGMREEPHRLQPYTGKDRYGDYVSFYAGQVLTYLDSISSEDREERLQYTSFAPMWEYEASINKVAVGGKYIVFEQSNYIYMGGAHGGVSGGGSMTFRKSDGKLLRSVIDRGEWLSMQTLLHNGLKTYFEECGDEQGMEYLFVDADSIPLPVWEPSLCDSGVVFVYQQYEIAPYAVGMPTFTVPYEQIIEFLTPDALELTDR